MKNMALIDSTITKHFAVKEKPKWVYVFPLFVLIVSTTIQYRPRADIVSQGQLAFVNDPTQLIIKGLVYIISLIFVIGRIGDSSRLILSGGAIYLLLLLYIIFSSLWSAFPAKVYITWGHFAGVCLVALAASFYFQSNTRRFLQFLAYTFSIPVLASIVASLLFKYGIDPTTGRWAGVTGNSNTFGVFIVIFLWSTIALLYIDKIRPVYLFLLAAGFLALWGAHSTTSLLVSMYVILSLVFLMKLGEKSPMVRVQRYAILGFLSVFGFLVIYFYLPQIFQLNYATSLVGKDATFTGRTQVWQEALTLIYQKPFFGWSFDAATSAMRHIQYAPGQFLNGYLDLLVRGGVIGFILFSFFLMTLLIRIRKGMKKNYMAATASLIIIGAILIHNMSEASIVRSATPYWLLMNLIFFSFDQYANNQTNKVA
jgi:O-antigen ligase